MTNEAYHAIRAVRNMHNWGLFAAVRYAKNHGVSLRIITLACQLQRNEDNNCLSMFLQEPTK